MIHKLVDFGTGAKSVLPDRGYKPKEDKEDDSAETKVYTKVRSTVTVTTATQTDSEVKAVAALKDLGARIRFNDQGRVIHVNLMGKGQITETDLVHLAGMNTLESLWLLDNADITDAGLPHLKGLVNLRRLDLWESKITDAGIDHLAGFDFLETLDVRSNDITDAGLEKVMEMSGRGAFANLSALHVDGCKVTKEGITTIRLELPSCYVEW